MDIFFVCISKYLFLFFPDTLSKGKPGMGKLVQALLAGPLPDLRGCTCADVESAMLSELVSHCKAAGLSSVVYSLYYNNINSCNRILKTERKQ